MKSLSCRYCGRTLTEEEAGLWEQVSEAGACPTCGRVYDESLERQIDLLAQDPSVVERARKKRLSMVGSGLLLVVAAFLLIFFAGVRVRHAGSLVIPAVPLIAYGMLYTARKQARTELTQHNNPDSPR